MLASSRSGDAPFGETRGLKGICLLRIWVDVWATAALEDRRCVILRALVVYDSVYGNTAQIAQAIGQAFASQAKVEVLPVGDVKPEHLTGVQFLIVGSPTRAFSPTPATKALLKSIPADALQGVRVAAFDTRIAIDDVNSRLLALLVKLFGYAAEPILRRLQRKGGEVVLPAEGFYVAGTEGPLKEGELERAAEWGGRILDVS